MRLSQFDMNIHHISGKLIPHVDAASRNPVNQHAHDPTAVEQQIVSLTSFQTRASFKNEIRKRISQNYSKKENLKFKFPKINKMESTLAKAESSLKAGIETFIILPV